MKRTQCGCWALSTIDCHRKLFLLGHTTCSIDIKQDYWVVYSNSLHGVQLRPLYISPPAWRTPDSKPTLTEMVVVVVSAAPKCSCLGRVRSASQMPAAGQ